MIDMHFCCGPCRRTGQRWEIQELGYANGLLAAPTKVVWKRQFNLGHRKGPSQEEDHTSPCRAAQDKKMGLETIKKDRIYQYKHEDLEETVLMNLMTKVRLQELTN